MLHRRRLLATLASTAASGFVQPAHSANDLDELQSDITRGQLFKRVVAAKQAEPPSTVPEPYALPAGFRFPSNADYDDGKPRLNSHFGIDISHYTDPSLDFAALRPQGVRFVYMKATQGIHNKDGRYAAFQKRLRALAPKHKLLMGGYHFLSSMGAGETQADTFCNFVHANGGFMPGDMPPVMDLEWDVETVDGRDRWADRSSAEIVATALAFLHRVQARTKMVPMVYTTVAWWKERNIPLSEFAKFHASKLWIADYSKSSRAVEEPVHFPASTANLWQFSADAKLQSGYGGELDANIFKGTPAQFKKAFGVALPS